MGSFVFIILLISPLILAIEDGHYIHDDSGRYVPSADDGRYIHDYSGDYRHDGTGNYLHQNDEKIFIRRPPAVPVLSSGFANAAASTNIFRQKAPKPIILNSVQTTQSAQGISQYPASREGKWRILSQGGDVDKDGFQWNYLTENRIQAEETGRIINKGTKNEGVAAVGSYSYTGPNNELYAIKYTADGNGFVAYGDHIPTPPPVPEGIQKGLNYLRSIGKL